MSGDWDEIEDADEAHRQMRSALEELKRDVFEAVNGVRPQTTVSVREWHELLSEIRRDFA